MATLQVQPSIWQLMIQRNFLSLYHLSENKINSPEYIQGYDFVFEFSDAIIYLLVNDVDMETSKQDVDATKVRTSRKEVVNQLIRRHNQLYLKNEPSIVDTANKSISLTDKAIYFVGLTSLSISHQEDHPEQTSYAVDYEYGSQFFAEDCVLDLDDEQSLLQVFNYQSFSRLLEQLHTPSDLSAFLQFHRSQLADFQSFQDESTLLQQFFQSSNFHQRAIKVQEQLVNAQLMAEVELRLLTASAPQSSSTKSVASTNLLMAEVQKNTKMWYKLFNSSIKRHYEACIPLPKEQVQILVNESMYTYSCLIEKILAYRNMDQESRWNGYVQHQHSYSVFGRHYSIVFYAQNESSSLSALNVRAAHQDLLSDLNAQLQQPVMDDLLIIGVDFKPCESSVNTEAYIDVFHQSGSVLDANTQRLYEQLAKLKAQA